MIQPLNRPNIFDRIQHRITEFLTTATNVVSYQTRTTFWRWRSIWRRPTNDWARSDYSFYRKAYRAQAKGLELSGLFIKPICSKIVAWSMGRPPRFRLTDRQTEEALDGWITANMPDLLRGYLASLKQGDSFLVINADLTITLVNPENVTPIVNPDNYSQIIGWRIQETHIHPEQPAQKMTVTDEYYADRRIHRVERPTMASVETVYPNLLDRLTIVHIANGVEDGETFGRSEAEALVELLHRYGAVFEAAIEGNIVQGRPTPVLSFENLADLNKFWELYGETVNQTLPDGTTQSSKTLAVDLSQVLTVSGAQFDYKSPQPFAGDTVQILEILFYLMLEHSELPEFVLGNAISSSKASADAQMPVFEKFIEGRRAAIRGWLVAIAEIVLGFLSLTQPGIRIEAPALQWQKLTQDGKLTLETVAWAFTEGLLDERTALLLAPVEVNDIDEVLTLARKEREEKRAQAMAEQQAMNEEIAALEDNDQE